MLEIFEDNKDFKINTQEYIDNYVEEYLESEKEIEDLYDEYDKIKKKDIKININDELNEYKKNKPKLYNFDFKIDRLFMKECLLESIKIVVEKKSLNDKDVKQSIINYKKI